MSRLDEIFTPEVSSTEQVASKPSTRWWNWYLVRTTLWIREGIYPGAWSPERPHATKDIAETYAAQYFKKNVGAIDFVEYLGARPAPDQ